MTADEVDAYLALACEALSGLNGQREGRPAEETVGSKDLETPIGGGRKPSQPVA
jgi:hypothetical protein